MQRLDRCEEEEGKRYVSGVLLVVKQKEGRAVGDPERIERV